MQKGAFMSESLKDIFARGYVFSPDILNAFENRKLFFFLGAGVSRIMGIPGWDEFANNLIKKTCVSYEEKNILSSITDNKEKITIAYNRFKQKKQEKQFFKIFGNALKPNRNVYKNKENIYEILAQFDATFLTTNADNLFQKVLGKERCHDDYDCQLLKNELYRQQNHLFYLHGHYDATNNNDKLVFTAPQYVARYNDEKFKEFLKAIFLEDNVILFVGYGLNEFELIDYIITKTGYSNKEKRKVYLLQGFCENDDILYEAKKTYFESLNIALIPYNLTKKGYDALIDVLKELYGYYQQNTIVPVEEAISNSIQNCSNSDYAYIKGVLNKTDLDYSLELQIVNDIKKLNSYVWTNKLYNDDFFSAKLIDDKIIKRSWQLFELFIEWIKSNEDSAQKAATSFLSQISTSQISKMKNDFTIINRYVTQVILSLKTSYIKEQYICLLKDLITNNNVLYIDLDDILVLKRIIQWKRKDLKMLLDVIFDEIDMASFKDNRSFLIKRLFNTFNQVITTKKSRKIIFDYFKLLILNSTDNVYNQFMQLHDLDNTYKNLKDYWIIALDEINYCFTQMDHTSQKSEIQKLLKDNKESAYKLGIYLARKYDHNVIDNINNEKFFSHYSIYHECYLLLKQSKKNGYITEELDTSLFNIINNATFGIDNEDDFWKDQILKKRLLLLQILTCSMAKNKQEKMIGEGISPYDSITIADNCDYVHSMKWENKIKITNDIFKEKLVDEWCLEFNKICGNIQDSIIRDDCTEQFALLILENDKQKQKTLFSTLTKLENDVLCRVLRYFHWHSDKIKEQKDLVKACLHILNESLSNVIHHDLVKVIIELLYTINIQDNKLAEETLLAMERWLKIPLDEEKIDIDNTNVINRLITCSDFYKMSCMIQSYIVLIRQKKLDLGNNEICRLIDVFRHENRSNIIRYTLCYHYQNVKSIFNNNVQITNFLFEENPFNMISLMLCVYNTTAVFRELTDLIKTEYLAKKNNIN